MWKPQPPKPGFEVSTQERLLSCNVPEIFFGGARGGGKTDGVLGKYLYKARLYGSAFNAVFFRREVPSLDDVIERAHEIYGPYAKWHEQKKTWRFNGGGRVRFRDLYDLKAASKYQGQNISDVCIEEAGDYPDPAPIFRLFGSVRSAKGLKTQFILTGNPGGPGHQWLKKRYIEPAPNGNDIIYTEKTNPFTGEKRKLERIYIPSRLDDNRKLLEKDPDYVFRLQQSGSESLVRAWLEGLWDYVEGAFFDCWGPDEETGRLSTVMPSFEIPHNWKRYRSMDFGSASPFSVGWWALAPDDVTKGGVLIPKGALIRYREWYGSKTLESGRRVGLKMVAEEIAKGILERQLPHEEFVKSVADPSMFKQEGGPSVAKRMWDAGVHFTRADNSRVSKKDAKGPMGGWDQMRARMKDNMIFCFDTCEDSIRTIPTLPHDPSNPEDLDTDAEDHAADEWRYMCAAKRYLNRPEKPKQEINYFYDPGITPREDEGWLR